MLKDIQGYEGLYAVNEDGQVWSYRSHKFLKPYPDGHGYYKVSLILNCKYDRRRVHRLVLETFRPVEGMEDLDVNHLNEQKNDNRLCNLTWLTHKDNVNYGTGIQRSAMKRSKPVSQFTPEGEWIRDFPSASEAERQTKICKGRISAVCNGKGKTAGGFIWRFKDGEREI